MAGAEQQRGGEGGGEERVAEREGGTRSGGAARLGGGGRTTRPRLRGQAARGRGAGRLRLRREVRVRRKPGERRERESGGGDDARGESSTEFLRLAAAFAAAALDTSSLTFSRSSKSVPARAACWHAGEDLGRLPWAWGGVVVVKPSGARLLVVPRQRPASSSPFLRKFA